MRLGVLIAFALGCGSTGAVPDGGPSSDLATDNDAFTADAFEPDAPDAFVCECAPFEGCVAGSCACDGDPLCGTAGFATFPMVAPVERTLSARDGVVDDALTGLSWERAMDGVSRTHAEARERCEALALDGHDDWRLPARVELATILDATRTPTLDAAVFGAAIEDYVWTASVAATGESRAFAIYFGQGETILATAELAGAHVRCVRGEREPAAARRIEGDWLVDEGAGLEWSVAIEAASTLAEAQLACEPRGARLPTLYELHALVDEGRVAPATDRRLDEASAPVWSTTERDFGEVLAWVMDFEEGTSDLRAVDQAIAARCVRAIP